MTTKSLDYYRLRAEEELSAAEQAGDPSIAQIHRDMARRYREILSSETGRVDEDVIMAGERGGPIAIPGAVFG